MHIYKNAKKVMLWIGEDGHYEDSLAFYLGRGTDAPTKAAPNKVDLMDPENFAGYGRVQAIMYQSNPRVVDMCQEITTLGETELMNDLKESKLHFMRGHKIEATPSIPPHAIHQRTGRSWRPSTSSTRPLY
jgi:hypothetical protein